MATGRLGANDLTAGANVTVYIKHRYIRGSKFKLVQQGYPASAIRIAVAAADIPQTVNTLNTVLKFI